MKVLSPNEIRRMVRKRAIQTGTFKAWAELNGVHPNHLSNFMKGWCGPPVGVLEALGIVRVYMLAQTPRPAMMTATSRSGSRTGAPGKRPKTRCRKRHTTSS